MDRIDRQLLTLLQRDASRTNLDLADEVGLAPSSCLRRIRRLKASGIIERTVAILDGARVGMGLKAIVTVELKEHGERYMRQFLERATRDPSVMQAYAVTGDVDVVLQLRLSCMEEFDALCERLFRGRSNVARFQTMIVTRTAKEETAIPL